MSAIPRHGRGSAARAPTTPSVWRAATKPWPLDRSAGRILHACAFWSGALQIRAISLWPSVRTETLSIAGVSCLRNPVAFIVTDDIDGPPGEHLVEQFWHAGSANALRHLVVEGGVQREAWRSSGFGSKHLGPVVAVEKRTTLPCHLMAALNFDFQRRVWPTCRELSRSMEGCAESSMVTYDRTE